MDANAILFAIALGVLLVRGSRRSASDFSAYPVNRLTVRPCSLSCGFDISMSKPESRCSRPIDRLCVPKTLSELMT
jgi:hypothetical protein